PDPAEALRERFALPAAPQCGTPPTLHVASTVLWLYDSPGTVGDHGCDLATGLALTSLDGPDFDVALASPAAHWVGTSTTAAAASFFSLAVAQTGSDLELTLTPVALPRQALYGARVTADWSCP